MKTATPHVHNYPATAGTRRTPLLFVHGGYVDSTCWEFNFIPFFQRHGHDCFSVDLSGHGRSPGHERIDDFGLDDYVADLRYAVDQIGQPLVLIGHSMGSRVVERFLETGDASAAIFLSPIPTMGTAASACRLALRYPMFFQALDAVSSGKFSPEVIELLTRIYFSPEVSPQEAAKLIPMIGRESQRAVSEMAMPEFRLSYQRRRLPALVIGGDKDEVFPASMLHFMGSTWNAEVYRAEGAGHMLMLDPQWEAAARHMLDWLENKLGLPDQPASAQTAEDAAYWNDRLGERRSRGLAA
ncbi:alpha/beta hydrolase [Rhodocyclus tenuis]|uniref:alpha/beta hydrolase n=1 Tax=Rhodocyclus tenuis TaxID=1066 RepID=UPI0019036C18|nr:alpha/beta hydrolase [Rhodocyclus tenuis]